MCVCACTSWLVDPQAAHRPTWETKNFFFLPFLSEKHIVMASAAAVACHLFFLGGYRSVGGWMCGLVGLKANGPMSTTWECIYL